MDVLATVQKLIELTNSSFEEEARTAAMRAIRLIQDHNLLSAPPAPKARREEIAKIADKCVRNLVPTLRELAETAVYPVYTPRIFAEMALEGCEISQDEIKTFTHYAKRTLKELSRASTLEYLPGRGYRLRYTMWDIAA